MRDLINSIVVFGLTAIITILIKQFSDDEVKVDDFYGLLILVVGYFIGQFQGRINERRENQ